MNSYSRHVALLAFAALCMGADGDEIHINLDHERYISGEGVRSVSIGNPAILAVKVSNDQRTIILSGKSGGVTTLAVVYASEARKIFRVIVHAVDVDKMVLEIKKMIEGIEGLNVAPLEGDRVRIDGSVYAKADLERVQRIEAFYGKNVLNLVSLDPQYVRAVRSVELEFNFAEVKRNGGGTWGIDWSNGRIVPTAEGLFQIDGADPEIGLNPASQLQYQAKVTTNLPIALNFLTSRGWATIHHTHKVVVGDGETAKYEAGGQLNLPVSGVSGGDLKIIPFGTLLEITPRLGRGKVIELGIKSEVSAPNGAQIVQGIPALNTNRVATKATLELGESVAIAGLVKREDGSSTRGVIGLHWIPILGYLFKTEEFGDNQTESVVYVTPRLVESGGPEQRRAIDRVLSKIAEYSDVDE